MNKKDNEGEEKAPVRGEEVDAETKEILDEMEDDGIDTGRKAAADSEKGDDKNSDSDDSDDSDEDEDSEEEEDEDEDDESDEDDDEDEEDDEDSDDSEEDEDDEDSEEDDEDDEAEGDDEDSEDDDDSGRRPEGRKNKKIPLWQHKKALRQQEKKLRKELVSAAKDASESTDDVSENDDDVKEIAKKYGLNEKLGPKLVADIIKAAANRTSTKITDEEIKKIRKDIADRKENEKFGDEMRKTEKTIRKLFGKVSLGDKARIQSKLRKIAYTSQYKHYSLNDILRLNRKVFMPKEKRRTGEGSGTRPTGKVSNVKKYDLTNPSSIPWDKLSDAEFDEVSAALEGGKSRVKIIKRRNNRR